MSAKPGTAAHHEVPAASLMLVVVLSLTWGTNWPILKMGVTELAPLTFRAATLGLAGVALLLARLLSGESIRVERKLWPRVIALSLVNITGWSALIMFGVQELPAGRSAILAYTMPIWGALLSLWLLHEPLSWRKLVGLALGVGGMAILLGEDIVNLRRAPVGSLLVIGAAIAWALGTVLLRRWALPLSQTTLSGWMMVLGWIPIAIAAPIVDPHAWSSLATMSGTAWFTVLFNIFISGAIANWAWFRMARTLPVVVSSLSSLPVPVVGVFSGMVILGERPGTGEFVALALVLGSLVAVMLPVRRRAPAVSAIQE